MDKYEYKLRSEEIEKLMENQKYSDAVRLADTIDWRRVKSAAMLQRIAELYKLNKRFEESRDILLLAYDRNPGSRNVIYGLCEISLEFGDIVQAIEYFKEFAKLAPRDIGIYTLRYRIYEAQNVGLEDKIELLEELKKKDRLEEWEYELAYLYHRAGFATKCVEECDEIILWFGEGPYVTKAMELKMLHEPLTPQQQEKYDIRNEKKIQVAASAADKSQNEDDLDFRVKTIDMSKFNTMNLQAELAENLKEYISDEEDEPLEPISPTPQNQVIYHNTIPADNQEVFFADKTADIRFQVPKPAKVEGVNPESDAWKENFAQELSAMDTPKPLGKLSGEDNINMETMPIAAMTTGKIKTVIMPDGSREEASEGIKRDMKEVHYEESEMNEDLDRNAKEGNIEERSTQERKPEATQTKNVISKEIQTENVMPKETQAENVMPKEIEEENVKPEEETVRNAMSFNSGYDEFLSQGTDGQISLAVAPQEKVVEKQITGQLNIADILADWERLKKENEQKMQEEVRKRVLEQTGELFSKFELGTNSGILASLDDQNGKLDISTASTKVINKEEVEAAISNSAAQNAAEGIAAAAQETVTEDTVINAGSVTGEMPGMIWKEVEASKAMEQEGFDMVALDSAEELQEETNSDTNEEGSGLNGENEAPETVEESDQADTAEPPIEIQQAANGAADLGATREWSDEDKALFGTYLYSKKMKRQIGTTLERITLASYAGNVIITGDAGSGAANLAKNLIRYVQLQDSNFSGNVAKISAENLNKKDIPTTFEKLANGALIIERANILTDESIYHMEQTLNQEGKGIIVIILDKKREIQKLLERAPKLSEFFDTRVDIIAMNTDMLVDYGVKYAYDKEYSVDDMGRLALYTRISDMQTGNHAVTVSEVKKIVDAAIKHANKGGLSAFVSVLARKRYDSEDMIILKEKDFEK